MRFWYELSSQKQGEEWYGESLSFGTSDSFKPHPNMIRRQSISAAQTFSIPQPSESYRMGSKPEAARNQTGGTGTDTQIAFQLHTEV